MKVGTSRPDYARRSVEHSQLHMVRIGQHLIVLRFIWVPTKAGAGLARSWVMLHTITKYFKIEMLKFYLDIGILFNTSFTRISTPKFFSHISTYIISGSISIGIFDTFYPPSKHHPFHQFLSSIIFSFSK
jgi:hypothetical protein